MRDAAVAVAPDRDAYLRLWEAWHDGTPEVRADLAPVLHTRGGALSAVRGPLRVVLRCPSEGDAQVRAAMLRAGGLAPEIRQNVFVIVHVAHRADVTLAMYGAGAMRAARLAVLCARHGVPFARTFGRIFPQAARMERWAARYRTIRQHGRALGA